MSLSNRLITIFEEYKFLYLLIVDDNMYCLKPHKTTQCDLIFTLR